MRLRDVFVDATFVRAVVDATSPEHGTASGLFDELAHEYVVGRTILHSHAGMVASVGDPAAADVMRICEIRPLRRHLLREARRVVQRNPQLDLCRDLAVALVIIRRDGIDEVATFDRRFRDLGIATLPAVDGG